MKVYTSSYNPISDPLPAQASNNPDSFTQETASSLEPYEDATMYEVRVPLCPSD